eukprot:333075-Rhodomonas_salina.1
MMCARTRSEASESLVRSSRQPEALAAGRETLSGCHGHVRRLADSTCRETLTLREGEEPRSASHFELASAQPECWKSLCCLGPNFWGGGLIFYS